MGWTGQMEKLIEKYSKKVGGIARACKFLDFKNRKQIMEACLVLHLIYTIELHSQGTVAQI